VATAFTGYLPEAASATARSVFCPREIERLLEHLDLHGLAAKQALQLANAFFETADFGRRHNRIIGTHRLLAALAHQPPPAKHQAG
jgi:hypothetical protein